MKDEILNMQPGRELDGMIIDLIGFELNSIDGMGHWVYVGDDQDACLFRPSENVRDAWHVVEEMSGKYSFTIQREGDYLNDEGMYEAIFGGLGEIVRAKTASEAICKAALLTVLPKAPEPTEQARAEG